MRLCPAVLAQRCRSALAALRPADLEEWRLLRPNKRGRQFRSRIARPRTTKRPGRIALRRQRATWRIPFSSVLVRTTIILAGRETRLARVHRMNTNAPKTPLTAMTPVAATAPATLAVARLSPMTNNGNHVKGRTSLSDTRVTSAQKRADPPPAAMVIHCFCENIEWSCLNALLIT